MKLKYLDAVKIVAGFYKGFEGIVVQHGDIKDHYYVDMPEIKKKNETYQPSAWIHEDNLEKI